MAEVTIRQNRTTFNVSSTPALDRLVEELAALKRERNRSKLVRLAFVLLADRDMPDWRERLGLTEEDLAA